MKHWKYNEQSKRKLDISDLCTKKYLSNRRRLFDCLDVSDPLPKELPLDSDIGSTKWIEEKTMKLINKVELFDIQQSLNPSI